jgi:hypothetical protein
VGKKEDIIIRFNKETEKTENVKNKVPKVKEATEEMKKVMMI